MSKVSGQQENSSLWPVLILFAAVLTASLFGIWSRPTGFLASIWPANAVMSGILLRLPGAARWPGWIAGMAAFLSADLLTGAGLLKAVMLNSANLAGVALAYAIMSRLSPATLQLRQPLSVLYILAASAAGALASGLCGGLAYPFLFGGDFIPGFTLWWVSEVTNYVAILPIFLSAPPLRQWPAARNWLQRPLRREDLAPLLAVLVSCLGVWGIGGPGGIAFPVLALFWCGLVYPVFLTAVLTLLCSSFALLIISAAHQPGPADHFDLSGLISIRLGVAVIAVAPVMLSVVIADRNKLVTELRYLSNHDSLTGTVNRAAFYGRAERCLQQGHYPHALLMMDLDHFKSINDTYGHAVGDEVLREISRRMQSCLRPQDLLGRMGGEEFALFLHHVSAAEAEHIAGRIRSVIADTPVVVSGQTAVMVTVSIGLTLAEASGTGGLEALLASADAALYRGKNNGRNRVEMALA